MRHQVSRFTPVPRAVIAGKTLAVGAVLLWVAAGDAALASPLITYGTYISEFAYDGSVIQSSTATTLPSVYTNGILSQTNTVADPAWPYASATATASLSQDQLSMSLSGSSTMTGATAEMWDTLTVSLPTNGTVTSNTIIGTLNMNVTGSIGTATYPTSAYAGYGLEVFDPAQFQPNPSSWDCGYLGLPCNGLISSSGLSNNNIFSPGSQSFTVDVTAGDLTNGSLAFIAEIGATNYSDPSLTPPLVIDPSITFSPLIAGTTVTSASGFNYLGGPTGVPEPGAVGLFGMAIAAAGLGIRRGKGAARSRATP